jgi:DNA repair protein RadC
MNSASASYAVAAPVAELTILREVELRYVGERRGGEQITASPGVVRLAREIIPDGPREMLVGVFLDVKRRPVGWYRFCGGIAATVVGPGDVFRAAMLACARSIVLVHNHPSGDPAPSSEDVALTGRVRRAGEILGVELLDHVVLGDGDYFSFLDAGLLK